jgi:predicted NBD/HSP70 family sugar kinase
LAKELKLTKAPISSIPNRLIEDGLVEEVGIGTSTSKGGRRPVVLRFNGRRALAISIDFGYNYYTAFLTYLNGETVNRLEVRNIKITKDNVLEYFEDILKTMTKSAENLGLDILGIAIAIHGAVTHNKIVFTPAYDLNEIEDFCAYLSSVTDLPIYLENEANLACLGEYVFASGAKRLLTLTMHSGVGAGIIQSGRRITGNRGLAGEFGHQILAIDGLECPCGNRGCLEQYASNRAIFNQVKALKGLDYVNAATVHQFIQAGDTEVIAIVDEAIRYLAAGINNAIVLYDPEVFIVNSSLFQTMPELMDKVHAQLPSRFMNNVIIRVSHIGRTATLYGGLIMVLQKELKIKRFKIQSNN